MGTLTVELVLLRGSSLLHAQTLEEIATLERDGQWRTPDGVIADAVGVPETAAKAVVKPDQARAAHRAQDASWLAQSLDVLAQLACEKREVTVDDCWMNVAMPPRRPSLMSNLMVAARRRGLIEPTARHRRSVRPINGGRTVRVWRSLHYMPTPRRPRPPGARRAI